jgi:hypothetical protein
MPHSGQAIDSGMPDTIQAIRARAWILQSLRSRLIDLGLIRASLFGAVVIGAASVLLPPPATSQAMPPADCHREASGSGSYCVQVDNQAGTVSIAITMASPRESTKTITYTGRSTAPGSLFRNDYYDGTSVLRYFGDDKIILQDDNGNPAWVYYR